MRALKILILVLVGAPTLAQDSRFGGDWKGALDLGQSQLPLVFHLSRDEEGWQASMDSPQQGATGIAASAVTVDGDAVEIAIDRIGGRFTGNYVDRRIEGVWEQGGRRFPLTLTPASPEDSLVNRPQEPQPPYPYRTETVSFPGGADGITLAGTLTLPEDGAPYAVAVLASGSGPQDRDETIFGHKPFKLIADRLTKAGLAVLRFDDRGVGDSSGDFAAATTEDFARDMAAAARYAADRDEIDGDRVALIGHSEGAHVATLAANLLQNRPEAVVMIAPAAATGERVLKDQLQRILAANGAPPGQIATALAQQKAIIDRAKEAEDAEAAKAAIKAYLVDAGAPEQAAEAQAAQMGSPWMRRFLVTDPKPDFESLSMPVFALFGSKDTQVSPELNRPELDESLKELDGYRVRVFEGLNHLMQPTQTGAPTEYGQIEQTMAPEVLSAITDWLTAQLDIR